MPTDPCSISRWLWHALLAQIARFRPAQLRRRIRDDWTSLDRAVRWYDVVLVVAIGAVSFAETLLPAFTAAGSGVPVLVRLSVGALAPMVAIAIRRTYPITAALIAASTTTFLGNAWLASAIALFGVGYHVARAWAAATAVVVAAVVPMAIWLPLFNTDPNMPAIPALLVPVFLYALPTLLGRYRRGRVALINAGWIRANQLEREHAMIAEQARLRERSRIAHDMHDSLGHDLSLIALQAGSLELAGDLPERHHETAQLLRTTTTDAMSRLRSVIGILREDATTAPDDQATGSEDAAGVPTLVERAVASGITVRLERPDEATPLPPLADRAVYRVVQEAMTNAAKHAPAGALTIAISESDGRTLVEVINTTPDGASGAERLSAGVASASDREERSDTGSDSAAAESAGGRGLIGLAERVRLAGGRFSTGPIAGGFRVAAYLPHDPETALTDSPTPAEYAAHEVTNKAASDSDVQPGIQTSTHTGNDASAPPADAVARLPTYPSRALPTDMVSSSRTALNRLRSGFWLRFVLPALAIVTAGTVAVLVFGVQYGSLSAVEYDQLQVGQLRSEAEKVLPSSEIYRVQLQPTAPPPPPGAECHTYLPGRGGLYLAEWESVYRICFRNERLVSKDLLDVAGRGKS